MGNFFASVGDGYEELNTAEEARASAQRAIDDWRDCCDPEWPEEVESVTWGEIREFAAPVGVEGDCVDYRLTTVPQEDAFKAYVHKRLDCMGVPADPDPARTEETGCRIGSRLNAIERQLDEMASIRDQAWIDLDEAEWSEDTKEVVDRIARQMTAAIDRTLRVTETR